MKKVTAQYSLNLNNIKFGDSTEDITSGDFFAGAGGITKAMNDIPGMKVKWVLNHNHDAIRTNIFHHPYVNHYWADIYAQDEHELEPVDFVHASFECTQHSRALGGKKRKIGSYAMGWELYRYFKYMLPLVIGIENVPEIKKWAPLCEKGEPIEDQVGKEFERWKKAIMDLGYNYKESIRNAADDGIPQSRTRYFAYFYRDGIDISFPEFTHSEDGKGGKKKWEACGKYLDLDSHGNSIFGREYNTSLPRHLRKKYKPKTLRRIAGGIKKYYPEYFDYIVNHFTSIMNGENVEYSSNIDDVIRKEKIQFIQDHFHVDHYNSTSEPLKPILTWQTKQMVTIDHFIASYYSGSVQTQKINKPLNTITTIDRHQLIRFEKMQFLTQYYSSNGKPEANVSSLLDPLPPQLTEQKHQLITLLDGFDIKARFLTREELAACSTFPRDYFSHPELKLSNKKAVKMIGNCVPPEWGRKLIEHNIESIRAYKTASKTA